MGGVASRMLLACLAATAVAAPCPAVAGAQTGIVPCGILEPCKPKPPSNPGGNPFDRPPQTINGQEYRMGAQMTPLRFRTGGHSQVRVTGSLSSTSGGGVNGQNVYLVARQWPYNSDQVVAQTKTYYGSFRFHVLQPRLNTYYYVRSDDYNPDPSVAEYVTSQVRQAVVFAREIVAKAKLVRPHLVAMRFAYRFPAEFALPLGGRPVHWYFARGRKVRQVRRSRTRVKGDQIMSGRTRFRIPRGRYRFGVGFCIDFPVGEDTGLGPPLRRPCP